MYLFPRVWILLPSGVKPVVIGQLQERPMIAFTSSTEFDNIWGGVALVETQDPLPIEFTS
jgi:hypothetical protein